MSHWQRILPAIAVTLSVALSGCGGGDPGDTGEPAKKIEAPGSTVTDQSPAETPKPAEMKPAARPAPTPAPPESPATQAAPTGALPGVPIDGEMTRTASGLEYFDIVVGDGPVPPGRTTAVLVHYSGWLTDGTPFDSSVERGVPSAFLLGGVIGGWTEGVGSMKAGGQRKLRIPPELAYGVRGRPGIPGNATLIFDVSLLPALEVAIPDPLPGTPVTGEWQQGFAGSLYHDLKVGDGPRPSGMEAQVVIHYTGWLTDGTKFDSSLDKGQPLRVVLGRIASGCPGWAEAISSMQVGGERKIIIPWQLGFGDRPNGAVQPRSDLVLEMELVDVVERGK